MKSKWLLATVLLALFFSASLSNAQEEESPGLKLKLIEPGPKLRKEMGQMPLPRPQLPNAEVLFGEESESKRDSSAVSEEREEKVIVVSDEEGEEEQKEPERTEQEPEKEEVLEAECERIPNLKVGPYRPEPEIESELYEAFHDLKESLLESEKALSDLVSVKRIFRPIEKKKRVDAYSLTSMLSEILVARETETAKMVVCTAILPAAEKVNFTPATAAHFFYELSRFYENSRPDLSFRAATLSLSYGEDSDYYEQLIKVAKEQSKLKEGSRAVVEYIKFLKTKYPSLALKRAAQLYEEWSETEPAGEFLENLLRSAQQ